MRDSGRILAGGITIKLLLAWLALSWLGAILGMGGHPDLSGRPVEAHDPRPARLLAASILLLLAMAYSAVLAAVQATQLPRRPNGWVGNSATAAGIAAGLGLLVCLAFARRIDGSTARFLFLQIAVYATVLGEGLAMYTVQKAMLRAG